MKPVIISVLLLSFLFSIDAAVKCYHCHERDSDTCEQEEKECPDGDRCMTISEEYKNNKTFHSIFKGCSNNMPCDEKPYGKVNDRNHLMINTKCCDGDLCNTGFYEMPDYDEPNGVVCPSCYEGGTTEGCKADKMTVCRGEDDKCLNFAGDVEMPDGTKVTYSAKGCMSALGCQLDLTQLIGVKATKLDTFGCTDAPPITQSIDEEDWGKIPHNRYY